MSVFKQIYLAVSSTLPIRWLDSLSDIPVLLPYHHLVSDEHLPHVKGLYNYKNKKQFLFDLEWLLKNRNPLHPDELATCVLERKPLPKKTFLLTFDDGFRESYDIVAPILLRKGVPAIFFVNPAFIDNKEFFYRCKLSMVIEKLRQQNNERLIKSIADFLLMDSIQFQKVRSRILQIHYPDRHMADQLGRYAEISFEEYVNTRQPFLTTAQLKDLHEKGFTLGAHSIDHPHYGMIDQNEQMRQTLTSLEFVNKISNSSFGFFSFPHEDKPVKQSFFTTVLKENNGPLFFFGTQKQLNEGNNHVWHRFNAERPEQTISQASRAVMFYHLLLRLFNQNKVVRS